MRIRITANAEPRSENKIERYLLSFSVLAVFLLTLLQKEVIMTDEEASPDQAQTEIDLTPAESTDVIETEEEVAYFDSGDGEPEPGTEKETPKEAESPAGQEEEKTEKKEEKKVELTEDQKEIQSLKAHVGDLNKAVSKFRKAEKEAKVEEDVLTDEQLDQLLEENKDDPKTVARITRYIAQKAGREKGKEEIDVAKIAQQKTYSDNFMATNWADAVTEGTELHKAVTKVKEIYGIDPNHPSADTLALGAYFVEEAPNLFKNIKEAGDKEGYERGLKEKAEGARKKSVKEGQLETTTTGKGGEAKVSGSANQTFKQMGLSPGALKIARNLTGNKSEYMEAE